ncbi:PREDICTED: mechanosensitive ion channel protein 2, chloroplastic [Camelina sativa]|uniref:Mechanosensitive ion channel protein 2, chloroplastic n=1 Tax=Camelina sativa TaxID=90675 RepID=A0ABM0T9B9_CAMSA|nr:PREDICTED: mechanosensitive ion channel protein 2, chloroplastic [Camelina sativa]XP_019084431.1 PREDICTED: mechanosensitive ion channel protein 2, chloroplastic [Camelina sativa]XP_019084432.1 PREDICTED: mechanosensitive ion channel protein 2, chloroplastic [Camelina sativa]
MALYGTLQLSHGMGLCRNQGCYKPEYSAIYQRRMHISKAPLSLVVPLGRHGFNNILLSDYLRRPICSVPSRTTAFRCHSFSVGSNAIEPAVKAVSVVLAKSQGSIQQFPFVYKLVPAVALLVFSLWGLVPVVRQGRNLLLNKNDNGWKKSGTYYVMTSYVQPLLLWLGALFICRALDPIVLPTEASKIVKDRLLNFVRSLSTVLAFAYCISSLIQQTQKLFIETSNPSDTRNMGFQFAGKAVYSAVWVAAVSLFMELLGFSTQKWLTAGGLGTVLITLAGREILTNFLSSVMIHATRPFVLNEWIQTKIEGYEVSGTVEHVGWWSPTIIRGEDREAIHIPNHKFTVNVVRNLTQKTHWRIKTHLAISHLDVNKINNIVADMRKVLAKNPMVEQQRLHRRVFLENVIPENQALSILISCFVKTCHHEEYLGVKEAILLDLLRVISHHRARLATPIRTIRKMYTDADVENAPFGESMYGPGGVGSRRPLMLIEPSYKINGEDKSKSQNRASKPTAEQENKGSSPKSKETSPPDPKEIAKVGESPVPDTNKVPDELVAKPGIKVVSKPATTPKDTETSGAEKAKAKRSSSTIKSPKTDETGSSASSASRSALEENIVLGVALEGAKRTLPIEEEIHSSSVETDTKELTGARRSGGNGPLVVDKEQKDGQSQPSSGAPSEQ